jgi:hypothetical protein
MPTWLEHWDCVVWLLGALFALVLFLFRSFYRGQCTLMERRFAEIEKLSQARYEEHSKRISDFHATLKTTSDSLVKILEELLENNARISDTLHIHAERISRLEGRS